MPFDRFTVEQIAGDMLPDRDGRAADRHRLPSQRDDQRGGRRRSRRSRASRCSSTASTRRPPCGSAPRSPAPSATTTSTIRSPRRTTTGCWRSSPTATSTAGRSATARATSSPARSRRRRSRKRRARRCRRRSIGWISELKTATPELARRAGAMGGVDACGQTAWTPLTPQDATATNGDGASTCSPTARCSRPAPNPPLDVVHRHGDRDAPADHRHPPRGAARPVAAAGRSRARRLRPLPRHRPARLRRTCRGWLRGRRRSPSRP